MLAMQLVHQSDNLRCLPAVRRLSILHSFCRHFLSGMIPMTAKLGKPSGSVLRMTMSLQDVGKQIVHVGGRSLQQGLAERGTLASV